ncbi:hypothetical protein QEH59_01645 [Coraliomargarita sp. SDUM461004]|uniref:AsmA family protein n=1 Tax=Thalassobacterium sedimentorum TaxID=3041258 RepID=A0ABU1AED7_9BACT|nr:hypothetical protein [Coraliomargarita sp. SDUM461004]MDQ8193111.1 hypothetical protein [Coraliomargarita sp. SDUM461004]
MFKKLLLGLLLIALAAGAVVYFVLSGGLNKQIKNAVETYGPRVTQTDVTLEDVNLSILSGSGTLKGLNVGNPEGYQSEHIFALGQIDLKIDTSTILDQTIIIDHILIKAPAISYEKSLSSSNVKDLMNNIEAFTGPSSGPSPDPEPSTGAKKQVVIKELLIEDGTVYVGALGVGRTVTLPRIEMNNIGEGGSMTMAEVMDLVLTKLLQSIGPAIADAGDLLKEGGKAALDAASKQATQQLDDAANEAVNKVGESLKGLLGN